MSPARILQKTGARWIAPAVIALFAILYVALAFFTDEALVMLVSWSGKPPLLLLLLLLPMNLLVRLAGEWADFRKRGRTLKGIGLPDTGAFTETVPVPRLTNLERGEGWLAASGYRTVRGEGFLAAVKGITLFPARFLFLAGLALFFLGLGLSLSTRRSERAAIIEGEPLPTLAGEGGVERIALEEAPGNPLLSRTLEVTVNMPGEGTKRFGLYPPGRAGGYFLYHRYLGVAPLIRFSAPDLNAERTGYYLLLIYPPGRQDTAAINDSPYILETTLVEPESGADPYQTGAFTFRITCKKGDAALFSREIPLGGAASVAGIDISVPAARRFVATDFLVDHGIFLLWLSVLLLTLSLLYYLPVRLLFPRREIAIASERQGAVACSRSEGRQSAHDGVFHELLDLLCGENAGDAAK